MEFAEHHFFSSNGTRLGCSKTGTGPALLLVHGTGTDHFRWNHVIEFFAPHFTIYALDRRGRGTSAAENQIFAIEREYEDIASVLEALYESTHELPYVIAHSFGAICTLGASLLTSHIKKMVLYEPPLPTVGNPIFPPFFIRMLQDLLTQEKREEVVEMFLRMIGNLSVEQIQHLKSGPSWQGRIAAAHTIVREVSAIPSIVIPRSSLASVQTPTLLLVGEESHISMKTATKWVHQALPQSQIKTLLGQNHVAMDTDRKAFVQAILPFLSI